MIKTILIDADGVVLKPRDKFFSQRMNEDFGVPIEKVIPFFKNEYKQVVIGKADMKESVQKYLADWNWDKSVDELLQYWFGYENKIDQEVLNFVDELRAKGHKCYVVSDHSAYRADNLMKEVGLEKHFDGSFFSGYVGYTKEEPEFFAKVLEKLGLQKDEVLFIDDDPKNVEIAESVGIPSQVFKSISEIQLL